MRPAAENSQFVSQCSESRILVHLERGQMREYGAFRRADDDEAEAVHGATDCVCVAAGGSRHAGDRDLPQYGVAEGTFRRWKKRYGGLGVSELRWLRPLADENRRLKQLVADLTLDKAMLQEVLRKEE